MRSICTLPPAESHGSRNHDFNAVGPKEINSERHPTVPALTHTKDGEGTSSSEYQGGSPLDGASLLKLKSGPKFAFPLGIHIQGKQPTISKHAPGRLLHESVS